MRITEVPFKTIVHSLGKNHTWSSKTWCWLKGDLHPRWPAFAKLTKKTTSTCRCCYLCYNLSLDPACKKTLLRSAALLARCCQFVKQSSSQISQSGLWYLHENQSNKHSNAYMVNTFMQLYVLLNWRLEAGMIIHVQLPHEDQTVAWQCIISTWKSNKVKLDLQASRHQGKVVGVLNRVTRVSSCYPLAWPHHAVTLITQITLFSSSLTSNT